MEDQGLVRRKRVQALLELQRYDAAIAELGRILAEDPEHAYSIYLIGHCLLKLDRPEEALHRARLAASKEPESSSYQVLLAYTELRLGRSGPAILHAEEAVRLDPESGESHLAKASALAAAGWRGSALESIDDALRIEPGHARALTLQSRILSSKDLFNQASYSIADALRSDANNSTILGAKAWNDFIHQRVKDSRADFQQVLALDPNNSEARRGLALSSSSFPALLAERERRAEVGPWPEWGGGWSGFVFLLAWGCAGPLWMLSGQRPEFLAFWGAFYQVALLFWLDTIPCLVLLPVLLDPQRRGLLPQREVSITTLADSLLIFGGLWCCTAPMVSGMHSMWGLVLMSSGSALLTIRFKPTKRRSDLYLGAYLLLTLALQTLSMLADKPLAVWTAIAALACSVCWHGASRSLSNL